MNDSYLLRFHSLYDPGRAYVFPCDSSGRVDLDALSERARANYLFARIAARREFTVPEVQPGPAH